ncbi:MAG: hypothetical protein WC858_00130 [Parcubacteria group bacterium]|jgi:hypothetical protein
MLRAIKAGGVVYLAVPDKRYTFDVDRPVTNFRHLENDFLNDPEISKKIHFEEWVERVKKIKDEKVKKNRVFELMNMDYSIHFHV